MKKQIIAGISAAAVALTALPQITFAADTSPTPILQYTFDNSKALSDENGKNELKLDGGATITDDGNIGKGLLLDGVDGYALLPQNIVSDSMTITSWVKINRFTTWGRVFDFGNDSDNNFFFAPYSGGTARIEMKTPKGTDTMDTMQETERDWVHYAVTVDNGTVSYYRNGRFISSKPKLSENINDLKNELNYIGKSHYDGDAYLAAVIDDFRIYDKALSIDEINGIFAGGNIAPETLLSSYSIEDGQIVTGDTLNLPKTDGLVWSETDALGLIDIETGAVKHNSGFEKVSLRAQYEDSIQDYTVYVTGADESPYSINIDAADRSRDVADTMWGLFFEDINSAADGGLYAELVQNRSFETEKDDHLYSWETGGNVKINTEHPIHENNPTYVTLGGDMKSGLYGGGIIINDGFQGISIREGEKYDFSMYFYGEHPMRFRGEHLMYFLSGNPMYLRGEPPIYSPGEPPNIQIILTDSSNIHREIKLWDGSNIEGAYAENMQVEDSGSDWKKLTAEITAPVTTDSAVLVIRNTEITDMDVDMISLIPQDTYKGHGLRKDMMSALEAMHPKFLRFPGGCAVEGQTMDNAWNWKDTVGDTAKRKEMINIWDPSAAEPYMMTYGLGFFEYFQMCEDLGMEPVPILNCGMACQVRSGGAEDEEHLVPMDKLQPYIDDALDLIEFANGTDESNEWVRLRIDMGHPEPFNMRYIGIGNEQYGDIYFERYEAFAKQIHERYPDIKLITTSGTASSGNNNDLAWNWVNSHIELANLVDEHYYESADWFLQHAYRYDSYQRHLNYSQVFLGEYASKGNTWYNALSEAAFMTGLERNADVVRMASYAPMFAKYGNTQWSAADMIWFNNDELVLTPNYYVQSLFSNNQGDYSLPTEVKMNGIENDDALHGGIVLGSWGTQNEFKELSYAEDKYITLSTSSYGNDLKYQSIDFSDGRWSAGVGEWSVGDDGILSQTSDMTGSTYSLCDDFDLTNYCIRLKAKKTGGGEGFQIGVATQDALNYYRVNIGGWGNTTAKIQHIVNGVSADTGNVAEGSFTTNINIEEGKWYDVSVMVSKDHIAAYVDGHLACSYQKPKSYGPVYASSVFDTEANEVVVKVVNTLSDNVPVDLNIDRVNLAKEAKTFIMEGDTTLENTLENPTAIAPYAGELTDAGNSFTYTAPANSLSVIRLAVTDKQAREKPYIDGYDDNTFRPDNAITRAEAAVLFARLSSDFDEEKGDYRSVGFSDTQGEWYSRYINFCVSKGYMRGYETPVFKPDHDITRAEFAVMLFNYLGLDKDEADCALTDISGHWAEEYIQTMFNKGIIDGYDDNTFMPNNTITRAEAVTMINKALGRAPAENQKNPFTDVTPKHWAYRQILEAAAE